MIPRGADQPSCIVIGAGVVGLSLARALATAGARVRVFDRDLAGQEASSAAAGMLCPSLEFDEGSPLHDLGLGSLQLFPEFARQLRRETGIDIDLRLHGTLQPLRDDTPSPRLSKNARLVSDEELRRLEPSISARDIVRAVLYEGEGSVDNRALVHALLASCKRLGVDVCERCPVQRVLERGGRVVGVTAADGHHDSDVVVNAAGAWAGQIQGPSPGVEVRPVKGQMLLLRLRPNQRGPHHVVYSHLSYIVPRSDGRIVVGTTVEDCGFDKRVEAGAIHGLLAGALQLAPGLSSASLVETWAGLRPRGTQQTPRLEAVGPKGYFVAIGHYRNGILLTPISAARLSGLILETLTSSGGSRAANHQT